MPLPLFFRLAVLLDWEYHLFSQARTRQGNVWANLALSTFNSSVTRTQELQAASTITNEVEVLTPCAGLIYDAECYDKITAKLTAWVNEVTSDGHAHYVIIATIVLRTCAKDPSLEMTWNASVDRQSGTVHAIVLGSASRRCSPMLAGSYTEGHLRRGPSGAGQPCAGARPSSK